jgi:phosphoserine phosphatase
MGNQFIVLDFDKTLYRKDSLITFHLFCLHKNPLLICWFPFQLFSYLLHSTKLISTQQFKNCYLLFLAFFSEKAIQHKARLFWEREFPNQFNEELLSLISNSSERIVIITASPVLYIQPLLTKLPNLTLLGTNLKNEKGVYIIEGQNCKGNEKVIRFKQTFGNDCIISKAYSDCLTDLPILALANEAFIVNENDIRPFKN